MQPLRFGVCVPLALCLVAVMHSDTLEAAQSVHVVKLQNLNNSAEERQVRVEDKCKPAKKCVPGLILPVWEPQTNMKFPTIVFRAFVYLMALFYLFLGVSIVADRFMAAIEVITSQEREVKVKRRNANGKVEMTIVLVRIWNETVSNLTLMALGSSAPEILLSVIEIFGNGFEAGDLGPGTIVGSAAFNLFIIIAICIATIPNGEKRRIERNDVFWVTLLWSTFAYIWLYLILCVISPSVVEVWEGVLTFVFFFLTVISSYIANVYTPALKRKILKTSTLTAHGHTIRTRPEVEETVTLTDGKGRVSETLLDNNHNVTSTKAPSSSGNGASNGTRALFRRSTMDEAEAQAFEDHRQKFVDAFQRLRAEHPDMPLRQIGRLVTQKTLADAPKSRAFRRMQATRQLTSYSQSRLASIDFSSSIQENRPGEQDAVELRSGKIVVSFQPSHYICAEDVGILKVFVKCERGAAITVPTTVCVNYETVDGTAKAGEDYVHTLGKLTFQPDVRQQEIQIRIVDNDVYEFDEEFFVRLSAPKAVNASNSAEKYPTVLGSANEALVIIVDDDHAGHFGFESQVYRVMENQGIFYLKVNRQRGARGKVIVPYKIVEGRAKRNVDFKCEDAELIFEDHQTTAEIRIEIVNDDRYEKSEEFYVELGEPRWEDPGSHPHKRQSVEDGVEKPDGRPFLNDNNRCKVVIKEDDELKCFVDRLVACANSSLMVGTSTWLEQFQEALSPPLAADDEDEDADGEAEAIDAAITEESRRHGEDVYAAVVEEKRRQPTPCQWMMHYLSLPWKLLFAFIPPTDYFHGWLCFVVAITLIGVLTAFIGDVAAMFGCTVGLKDTVTAITLVALGTSLPDTFASKLAAVQDKTADSSIGNVTGSNAVNVFLGIGIAWALAAIYHSYKGDVFHVHAGSLEASVALFLIGSVVCTIVLEYRRFSPKIGAELGGPPISKWVSVSIFVSVWILYIIYCVLDAYCII